MIAGTASSRSFASRAPCPGVVFPAIGLACVPRSFYGMRITQKA